MKRLYDILLRIAVTVSLSSYGALWVSFNAAILVWLVAAVLWVAVGVVWTLIKDATECPPYVRYVDRPPVVTTHTYSPLTATQVIRGGREPEHGWANAIEPWGER
jgi:hypothetical protein